MQIGRREDAAAFVQPLPLMPVAAGIRQPKTHTEQFANSLLCSPTSLPAWKNVVPCAALLRWTENPCAHNINFKFLLSPVNEPPQQPSCMPKLLFHGFHSHVATCNMLAPRDTLFLRFSVSCGSQFHCYFCVRFWFFRPLLAAHHEPKLRPASRTKGAALSTQFFAGTIFS